MRIRNPLEFAAFVTDVVRAFHRNQGLLLAGAVAYYALLSILPLLILSVIGLSQLIERAELLAALDRYIDWLLPGQSAPVLADINSFLDHRGSIGLALLGTLLFFSSLAFSVLEKAMATIFAGRPASRPRHFLVSILLPYGCMLLLGGGLVVLTALSVALGALAGSDLELAGVHWSLADISHWLLQFGGLLAATAALTAFYLIIPPGRTRPAHALLGGAVAALLWAALRHGLIWYFASVSRIGLVYGSLSSAVMLLLVMELAATLLLLGAQVIAVYERRGR